MSRIGNVIRRYSENNTIPKDAEFITEQISKIKRKEFKPRVVFTVIQKVGGCKRKKICTG